MAAASQPLDGNPSERDSWQALVQDNRYRLFAAGNRRAAIAESTSSQGFMEIQDGTRAGRGFDAQFGLKPDAPNRMVLMTEVARVPDVSECGAKPANNEAGSRLWRWEATHRVQPISQLRSYIDAQSGSCVFFLTRTKQPVGGAAVASREAVVDSALRIGKSLGLDAKNLEALRVAGMVHQLGKIGRTPDCGEKYYVTADDDREESECCRFDACMSAATACLEAVPYCTQHFISTSYEKLDSCADILSSRQVSDRESEMLWSFLSGCIEQAQLLTRDPFHQEPLERARLLDIAHTAIELSRHMRRSPRLPKAIPVRLMCETPGHPWEEDVRTKLISRHGAMLECEHIVRPEDWLFVERVDTGTRARARMAWRGSVSSGRLAIALEFVDADNFWQMNWPSLAAKSKASKVALA